MPIIPQGRRHTCQQKPAAESSLKDVTCVKLKVLFKSELPASSDLLVHLSHHNLLKTNKTRWFWKCRTFHPLMQQGWHRPPRLPQWSTRQYQHTDVQIILPGRSNGSHWSFQSLSEKNLLPMLLDKSVFFNVSFSLARDGTYTWFSHRKNSALLCVSWPSKQGSLKIKFPVPFKFFQNTCIRGIGWVYTEETDLHLSLYTHTVRICMSIISSMHTLFLCPGVCVHRNHTNNSPQCEETWTGKIS